MPFSASKVVSVFKIVIRPVLSIGISSFFIENREIVTAIFHDVGGLYEAKIFPVITGKFGRLSRDIISPGILLY